MYIGIEYMGGGERTCPFYDHPSIKRIHPACQLCIAKWQSLEMTIARQLMAPEKSRPFPKHCFDRKLLAWQSWPKCPNARQQNGKLTIALLIN